MALPVTVMDGGGEGTTPATTASDSTLESSLGIAPILLTDASKYKDA